MHIRLPLIIILFILAYLPGGSALAAAGKVVFAFGDAAAIGTDGTRRDLKRGVEIQAGDTLRTLQGRAQVRFSDGGFVSLQPRTEFKVDDFRYSGRDLRERVAFFQLVRGGIRAVTGAIGRRNKANYRVNTPVGTIGIRGTAFTALICAASCVTPWGATLPDGLYTKTGDGIIYIANNAGSIDLPVGSGGFIPNIDSLPVETTAPPPTTTSTIERTQVAEVVEEAESEAEALFTSGEQFGEGGGQQEIVGDVAISQLTGPGSLALITDPNELFIGAATSFGNDGFQFAFVDGVVVSPDARTARGANSVVPPFEGTFSGLSSATLDTAGSTANLLVERYSGGTLTTDVIDVATQQGSGPGTTVYFGNESYFQVSGRQVNSIPTSGNASFVMAGSSASATLANGPLGNGATLAQVNVNFTSGLVDVQYQVDHQGTLYNALHSAEPLIPFAGAASSSYVFGANGGVAFGGLGACSSGCGSFISGFLSGNTQTVLGNTPAAAGFTYVILESNPIQGGVALDLDPNSVVP